MTMSPDEAKRALLDVRLALLDVRFPSLDKLRGELPGMKTSDVLALFLGSGTLGEALFGDSCELSSEEGTPVVLAAMVALVEEIDARIPARKP